MGVNKLLLQQWHPTCKPIQYPLVIYISELKATKMSFNKILFTYTKDWAFSRANDQNHTEYAVFLSDTSAEKILGRNKGMQNPKASIRSVSLYLHQILNSDLRGLLLKNQLGTAGLPVVCHRYLSSWACEHCLSYPVWILPFLCV